MYKTLLVPVDLNHETSWQKALPIAIEYCKALGAQLYVMTAVASYFHFLPTKTEAKVLDEVNEQLHAFIKQQVPRDISVQPVLAEGIAYHEIIRVAREIGADLIVMASHHPELKDYLLEPTAERVLRHSDTSVLVVRN